MIGRPGSQTELPLATASVPAGDRGWRFCGHAGCGKRLINPRPDQKYCNDSCRNAQWRLDHPRMGTSEAERHRERTKTEERPSIQERFEAWVAANPELYRLIRQYAYRALEAGRSRFGIAAIVERVRWDIEIESEGDDFKINNDFRSRLVRKLIDEEPRFEDLFETRALKAD